MEYVIVIFWSWLIFVKSWNICQDLYRSVQIHTETFFKISIERRVYLVEHFLTNKYLNFKLYLRLVKFRQILEYLSRSVRICTDSQGVLNMRVPKIPKGLENHFFLHWKQQKSHCLKNAFFFEKSHSVENLKESSVAKKRFVSSKIEGFDKNKLEKK